MSAIQEQTKSLKLNASNIKSVLVNKNKRLKNLRKIKSRIVDVNMRQAKQAKVAAKQSTGADVASPGLSMGMDIFNMGLDFLKGVFKFISLLMVGLLFNNLPAIVDTVKNVWKTIKPAVTLVWNIMRTIGRTMMRFGKWVVSLFVPERAKMDLDNIEEGNKELETHISELMGEDDNLDGGSDEGGSEESDSGTEETSDKSTDKDIKPAVTSTSPPSASKGDEVSKDGTGDKLVKEKPLPKEETKTKKSKTEEKSKEQWTLVDVNEKGFVYKNAAGETKTVIPKNEAQRISHQRRLAKKNRKQTFVIKGNEVSAKKADPYTTQSTIELIQTGALKFIDKQGKNVTPVLKTTNTESLGKEKPNTPTVVVLPIKETKVKRVAANNGGGSSHVSTGSVSSPQPSKLRNSVI